MTVLECVPTYPDAPVGTRFLAQIMGDFSPQNIPNNIPIVEVWAADEDEAEFLVLQWMGDHPAYQDYRLSDVWQPEEEDEF